MEWFSKINQNGEMFAASGDFFLIGDFSRNQKNLIISFSASRKQNQ
jgi:hypothetical protein